MRQHLTFSNLKHYYEKITYKQNLTLTFELCANCTQIHCSICFLLFSTKGKASKNDFDNLHTLNPLEIDKNHF